MRTEGNYQFREFLAMTHLPGRRDPLAKTGADELAIDGSWRIVVRGGAATLVVAAAKDLQDYLLTSMGVALPLQIGGERGGKAIRLDDKGLAANPRAYTVACGEGGVDILGESPRGVAQGCYYLEDLMNLREAPFLRKTAAPVFREPLFSPRMVHSGWGMDQFPDSHLNAIAHAGFDTILVFAKGVDRTTHGVVDFNDLVRRADAFGLDVYFYSYLDGYKHPDDADAEAFFDRNFGELFKNCPGAKGLVLVGESCQFPSKDPDTTGNRADHGNNFNQGIADHRRSPGWWPCSDYPRWLEAVKKAVRRHQPEADIVFWTYNWGRAPEKNRVALIEALPQDVALQATFEMYQSIAYPNHMAMTADYSITFPGPGDYFLSEAKAAKRRGLRLYTMSNTAGTTWDCGVLPYVPTPQQWFKRFEALRAAKTDFNLSGLMDSHHYGWYPSPICECAKWSFWSPDTAPDDLLRRIAARDFGQEAAPSVIEAWALWSEAMGTYSPGFDDQAGPLRVGPAYPLIFHPNLHPHVERDMKYPTTPQSIVGSAWLYPVYHPEHLYGHTACGRRIHEDIRMLERTLSLWRRGDAAMDKALALVPERKLAAAAKQAGVGKFFGHALLTTFHAKRWWVLNKKLEVESDFAEAEALMDEMEAIVDAEAGNVRAAIPLVELDSRLGWEPSMDYMADKWHLEWKLRQLANLRDHTLKAYRSTLSTNPPLQPL